MSTLYNLSPISTFTRSMTVCKYTFMGFHNAMRVFLLIAMAWAFTSMKAQNTVKIKGTVNDAGGSGKADGDSRGTAGDGNVTWLHDGSSRPVSVIVAKGARA